MSESKERIAFVIKEAEGFVLQAVKLKRFYPKSKMKQQTYCRQVLFYYLRNRYGMGSRHIAEYYDIDMEWAKAAIYCMRQRINKEQLKINGL